MEALETLDLVSLGGSAFATALTLFFWVVKSGRERPRLKSHVQGPLEASQAWGLREGTVRHIYSFRLIVANYSSLPNAILVIRIWVQAADGNWRSVEIVRTPENPVVPVNLPPLTTGLIGLSVALEAPSSMAGNDNESKRKMALSAVASPFAVKIELTGLGGRRFTDQLTLAASE